MKCVRISTVVLLAAMASTAWADFAVNPGYDANASLVAASRYRSFRPTGANEIYIGVPDLGVAANRNEAGVNWASGLNTFELSYTPGTGILATTVDTTPNNQANGLVNASRNVGPLGMLNYLQIELSNRDSQGGVLELQNLVLTVGGMNHVLGNFAGAGFNNWNVTGLDLSQGFTLSGGILRDLSSGGFSGSQESSRVEFKVGRTAPVPAPGAIALGALGLGLLRRLRGVN